jgi:Bardet-Biedl syndrome 1 protein
MTVLLKSKEEEDAVGCLVLGTESKKVLILSPSAAKIIIQVELPSVPVFICATGLYDVDYRIVVACRNGNIYTIKV